MNKMQTEPIAPAVAAEAPEGGRLRKRDGTRNWTRTILMLIVPALLRKGYRFVTVPELLNKGRMLPDKLPLKA